MGFENDHLSILFNVQGFTTNNVFFCYENSSVKDY